MHNDRSKASLWAGHSRFQWVIQTVAFAFFVFLFIKATYPSEEDIPYGFFQRLDPLVALAAGVGAQRWLVLALLTLLATLLLGRIFCSYVCPLGFLIDLVDVTLRGRRPCLPSPEAPAAGGEVVVQAPGTRVFHNGLRELKYWILGAVLAGIVLGNASLLVVDPLSLITRVMTVVFYPLWIAGANLVLVVLQPLALRMGWLKLAYLSYQQPAFQTAFTNLLLLVLLVSLGLIARRFWCRYLCPLGALLGILSRFSLIRRKVDDRCNHCGRCAEICPMDAVGHDPKATALSECTNCEACHRVCPESAIAFSYGRPSSVDARFPGGLSRRGFLGGLGVGVCATVLTRLHPGVIKDASRLLRPPGAIPESEFLGTCVRCGLCIRACVTHTLQASGAERGLLHWGTPLHVMRFAGCEQQCALCGEVCPTGAIRKLTLVERQHAKVGTAVLSQERCVAWKQDQLCLLCDEACPYNAIVFHTIQGHKRPLVDETRCNGCGMCECVCPVQGESAIIVHQDGEVRLAHGSYREVLRERKILLRPKSDILG